jgi:hypothetical protein
MGSGENQARSIAERIAQRISQDPQSARENSVENELTSELAAMRASLGQLQLRLGQLEAQIRRAAGSVSLQNPPVAPRTHSPWLEGVNAAFLHPSQEKFGIEEATVTQLVDFFQNEKQCTMEPGGKPCDHCAMCSSRGF